ncbi:adenylyltransferase/cytidyltransferase family protein [Leekyejoonella antrihumi]|uniref:Phosphopantetheine adenylyltransferase n=1 Tax=Leekyejoonella antrihumi TaxID=1660198 RepID=A0A563E829_9MICO|nr:adenylyltransferase/cytidyltransferase family protein [Leekyejoonella antrihumi]TWP38667.1 glycerol-3-phosphate cytidylyltransferase [Leekyejoonella antrihumi]
MNVVIVSGYFNPLHGGHLDMIESAAQLGEQLIVVVNNDTQQRLKKGKIILDESNRLRLMRAIKGVDSVVLAIDDDPTIVKTLEMIARQYPGDSLTFANGGDRNTTTAVPETDVCDHHHIRMVFGTGGAHKSDSSTRINQALGHQEVEPSR